MEVWDGPSRLPCGHDECVVEAIFAHARDSLIMDLYFAVASRYTVERHTDNKKIGPTIINDVLKNKMTREETLEKYSQNIVPFWCLGVR